MSSTNAHAMIPARPITASASDLLSARAVSHEALDAEFVELPSRQLRDYLRVLTRHRWLAAVCFLSTFALAIVYTLRSPRLYTAAVRLQVGRNSPIKLQLKDNVLNLDETDRIVNGASSFLATQVQVLRSRDLAERVMRQAGVASVDDLSTLASTAEALRAVVAPLPEFLRPRGFEEVPHRDRAAGTADAVPIEAPALDTYMGSLEVQEVRGTDLIDVRFTTRYGALSAVLAAAHAQAYLDANHEAQLVTDATAVDFLEAQLDQVRADLARADTALRQFAGEHPNVAVNQEHDLVGKQIQELSSRVGVVEAERAAAQTRYAFLSKAKSEPLAHFLDASPTIQKLRLALLDVEEQRGVLKLRLGPNHSQMVELRRQTAELSVQLQSEVEQEIAAAKARFAAARLHEQELQAKLGALEKSSIELRNLGAQYELLKANLQTARNLHESLLRQKSETTVHSQLSSSNVRVVERPEPPLRPSHPHVPTNLAFGLIGGLCVAAGAVCAREAFDDSMRSAGEVQGVLQLPTLALIPDFERPPVNGAVALTRLFNNHKTGINGSAATPTASHNGRDLVVLHEPWSPVAETFRSLRTALLFSNPTAPPKLLLVTSAATGEGKTVTALNLATTLADAGWRVLLIDGDLRDPRCHHSLHVTNRVGLSTYLTGNGDLDTFVQQLHTPPLAFIPAGPPPPNPAELLGSTRMQAALDVLRARYDFIVVDSPPALAVTDAVVLARQADGVVLVVKGDGARRELIRRARDQLLQAGATLVGVVVNKVGPHWGDFGYYDSREAYYQNRAQPEERSA